MALSAARTIAYQPALDGVRAVAVIMVLAFHLGYGWMSGGYLGVSVFFTLSGYLITTLLVTELAESGTIRLTRFYARRARRLLPASLLCLALVSALIASGHGPDRSGLRWYVSGALFQFANWVPLGLRDSYAEIFQVPAPTEHFWSLAIEEQFYLIWPVTILGLFLLVRTGRRDASRWLRRLGIALAAVFAVTALSAPATARWWSSDAAYFATWARIAEIVAGAVVAVIVLRWRPAPAVRWLAPLCGATVVLLAVITPAGRGFAYEGGLPLFALLSAGLLAGVQVPSPTRRLLSTRPLVALGRISYGVYLYHWPVFVFLDPGRTGWSGLPLAGLRVSVTLAIAVASYLALEQPIRERRLLVSGRSGIVALATVVPLLAFAAVTVVANRSSYETAEELPPASADSAPLAPIAPLETALDGGSVPVVDPPDPPSPTVLGRVRAPRPAATAAPRRATIPPAPTAPRATIAGSSTIAASTIAASTIAMGTTIVPMTTAPLPTLDRPVRVLVVGDSTAQVLGKALAKWARRHPDLMRVETIAYGGCALLHDGERRYLGEWQAADEGCVRLVTDKVPRRVRTVKPDLVLVVAGFWDTLDHRWDDSDPTGSSPSDVEFREQVGMRFVAFNRDLLDAGAGHVAWVTYPDIFPGYGGPRHEFHDPARRAAFHEIERLAAAPFPGQVSMIELAAWSDAAGFTADHSLRPDGVHFSAEAALAIAQRWLAGTVIQVAVESARRR